MARQRFVAPQRGAVDPRCWSAPLFDGCRPWSAWLHAADWPSVAALDAEAAARGLRHAVTGRPLRFVAQTAALLADGLHYEQRIAGHGVIATRADNWHDLFNALVWLADPALKSAINARQVADLGRAGPGQRTRAQCALTHLDEAGAIVRLSDPALLALWDAHDWHGLFWRARAAWQDGRASVRIVGHALLEHGLQPHPLHTAKCVAVLAARTPMEAVPVAVADAVVQGRLLDDPQALRPLPLSGIPGWHPDTADARFYAAAECFRPLRAGRRYPAPLVLD